MSKYMETKLVGLSGHNPKSKKNPLPVTALKKGVVLSDMSNKNNSNLKTAINPDSPVGVGKFVGLSDKPEHTDRTYKIVICGDAGVGKSCIFQRFLDNTYVPFGATIGVDFRTKYLLHNPTQELLQINCWDTAGQEKFKSIVRTYFRGAHGIMLVFDITNSHSFTNIEKWIEESKNNAPTVSMILVGNKAESKERVVSFAEASAYAEKVGIPYIETSAKTGLDVDNAFYLLIDRMWDIQAPIAISRLQDDRTVTTSVKGPTKSFFCCGY